MSVGSGSIGERRTRRRRRRVAVAAIAIGLLAPGIARSQPPTIPTVPGAATVVWDRQGVPHVYAGTDEEVFFGFGFATATDRANQIEILRRAGTGTLSELIPTMAGSDYAMRRDMGGLDGLRAKLARFPERIQGLYRAYSDGVNAAWRRAGFTAARPWAPTDSVAIGLLLTRQRNLGGSMDLTRLGAREVLQTRYGEQEGAWRAADLFKPAGRDAIPTVHPGEDLGNPSLYQAPVYPPGYPAAEPDFGEGMDAQGRPARAQYASDPDGPLAGLEASGARLPSPETILDIAGRLHGIEDQLSRLVGFGSQEWSVTPGKSATGHAVLYDAPSVGINSPALFYQVHLKGGSYDVAGVAIPGSPGIVIGHNRFGAWGLTDAHSDQEDAFVEVLCTLPGSDYAYRHEGRCEPMDSRTETFGNPASPSTKTFYYTVHGPVVSIDDQGGTAFAFQRLPGEELGLAGFEELMRARTWQDAERASRPMRNANHLTWADREGHIMYQLVGGQPVRAAGLDGQYPVPGTGEWDWLGELDATELPAMLDPAEGYLGNANNRAAPGWRFRFLDTNFAPPGGHIDVIDGLLAGDDEVTVEEQIAITHSYEEAVHTARYVVPLFLGAASRAGGGDPDVDLAAGLLRSWDRGKTCRPPEVPRDPRGGYSCPALELFNRAWGVASKVVSDDLKGIASSQPSLAILAFQGRTSVDYVDDPETPQVEIADEVLVGALRAGVAQARRDFGSDDPDTWTQQGAAVIVSHCPIVNCPAYPAAVPGTTAPTRREPSGVPVALMSEVEATSNNTYRQVVVLDDTMSDARWIIMPGNSEDLGSPHFRDNVEDYRDLVLHPWWFEDGDVFLGAEKAVVVPHA